MVLSRGPAGVYAAMAANALAYNLASGTREALLYDSLLQAGEEGRYLSLSALDTVLYRVSVAAATLCAGGMAALGYRRGYAVDLLLSLGCVALALGLREPAATQAQARRDAIPLRVRLGTCLGESAAFLRSRPRLAGVLLLNALVGAAAVLLGFFLQDGLSTAGASPALLGPLLLGVGLGGAVGARLAVPLGRLPYWAAFALSAAGVALGLGLAATGVLPLMAAGGFLAALSDDALQIRTDADLNGAVPSDQRATLVSVSSLIFSLVMVGLSPLAGRFFW